MSVPGKRTLGGEPKQLKAECAFAMDIKGGTLMLPFPTDGTFSAVGHNLRSENLQPGQSYSFRNVRNTNHWDGARVEILTVIVGDEIVPLNRFITNFDPWAHFSGANRTAPTKDTTKFKAGILKQARVHCLIANIVFYLGCAEPACNSLYALSEGKCVLHPHSNARAIWWVAVPVIFEILNETRVVMHFRGRPSMKY